MKDMKEKHTKQLASREKENKTIKETTAKLTKEVDSEKERSKRLRRKLTGAREDN